MPAQNNQYSSQKQLKCTLSRNTWRGRSALTCRSLLGNRLTRKGHVMVLCPCVHLEDSTSFNFDVAKERNWFFFLDNIELISLLINKTGWEEVKRRRESGDLGRWFTSKISNGMKATNDSLFKRTWALSSTCSCSHLREAPANCAALTRSQIRRETGSSWPRWPQAKL